MDAFRKRGSHRIPRLLWHCTAPIRSGDAFTSETTLTVANLVPSTTYYFAVTATNGSSESDYPKEAIRTVLHGKW